PRMSPPPPSAHSPVALPDALPISGHRSRAHGPARPGRGVHQRAPPRAPGGRLRPLAGRLPRLGRERARADGAQAARVAGPVSFEDANTAFKQKRYDEALRLLTAYTTEKPDKVWGYYMLGLSAWKAGDRETAVNAFTLALEKDSTHVKS